MVTTLMRLVVSAIRLRHASAYRANVIRAGETLEQPLPKFYIAHLIVANHDYKRALDRFEAACHSVEVTS